MAFPLSGIPLADSHREAACRARETASSRLPRTRDCLRILIIIFLLCIPSVSNAGPSGQTLDEHQVKAAFLVNFIKFVDWPPEALGEADSPITVGVVASDALSKTIGATISGKTVNGRPLSVKRFNWSQNLRACHILFISSSEGGHLPQILGGLRGASVLTVGEMDTFNKQGGIINFIIEGGRVRFEINQQAAEAVRLKISSKLLQLAKPGATDHRPARN